MNKQQTVYCKEKSLVTTLQLKPHLQHQHQTTRDRLSSRVSLLYRSMLMRSPKAHRSVIRENVHLRSISGKAHVGLDEVAGGGYLLSWERGNAANKSTSPDRVDNPRRYYIPLLSLLYYINSACVTSKMMIIYCQSAGGTLNELFRPYTERFGEKKRIGTYYYNNGLQRLPVHRQWRRADDGDGYYSTVIASSA